MEFQRSGSFVPRIASSEKGPEKAMKRKYHLRLVDRIISAVTSGDTPVEMKLPLIIKRRYS